MPYTLKNLFGFPLDVATSSGPAILPANGELSGVELGALDAEIMRQSPYVEMTEHDGAKKPASPPTSDEDQMTKLRADYLEVVGKRAYHGWSAEELQAKIDEKLAE
ncbi:hypothetical protein [Agrobacterium pusense]|uniref:hypothetical protein n=1 Tax=Agrobacterium pusense TaxID=648995 RepID=UPI0010AE9A12|nr:hypothetical protein [Agrobacterium pusense]WCK26642.1 hypothetical protein CFBP5496_0020800 [Agrobacterium pusense]